MIGTSYWVSEAAMHAREAKVRPARQRVARELGSTGLPDVRIYEVPVFVVASPG